MTAKDADKVKVEDTGRAIVAHFANAGNDAFDIVLAIAHLVLGNDLSCAFLYYVFIRGD